jgi:hypothetical protein
MMFSRSTMPGRLLLKGRNLHQSASQGKGYGYESVMAALLNDQDLDAFILVPQKSVVPGNDFRWPQKIFCISIGPIVNSCRYRKSHDNNGDERFRFSFYENKDLIIVGLYLALMIFTGPKANEREELESSEKLFYQCSQRRLYPIIEK